MSAEKRIAEFLRQQGNLPGVDPEELYTVYSDPEGEPATLRASDLRTVLTELELAFSPGMYLDIQKVLDEALGTSEADGAGAGVVADIALLADQKRAAEAEAAQLRQQLEAESVVYYAMRDERDHLAGKLESATASVVALSGRVDTLTARCEQQERDHAETVAEVERLRAKVAKDHDELRDKRTDLLNIRGILKPAPGVGDPAVPMPLGHEVAPAVEWLVEDVARLRAAEKRVRELHTPFDDEGVTYCGWDGHEGCGHVWPCPDIRALDGGAS